jgi:hypothetical protein
MANDLLATEATDLERLVGWFESWEQSTESIRSERERERDFYDGKQWTDGEIARLKKRKQPVVTYNRIAPKINSLTGLEESRRQEPRAFPRNTPSDDQAAAAATDALKFVLDGNSWDDICSAAFKNHSIEGTCGVDVAVELQKDGSYDVVIKHIPWDRHWGDEHSRSPDFEDGKYKGQCVWMDLDDAILDYPQSKDVLEQACNQSIEGNTYDDTPRTRWVDPKRKRVRIVDCWSKEGGKIFYSCFTKAGLLERTETPYVDEKQNPDDGYVFHSCFVDREGARYGMVKNWISVQEEINKRRSKAMHLLNSNRVQMERGAVEDVNVLKRELADPEGVVVVRPGMKLEVLDNKELADAQLALGQEAKAEIDAVGVNAALAGTERRVMSGRALEQRSEQGLNEVGPVFGSFKSFQLHVYRKVWNRIRQFWNEEKWFTVTEDEQNFRMVGLNVPITLGEQLIEEVRREQGDDAVTPEMQQQAQMDPQMQQIVGVRNNVGRLDVDIRIDRAEASASLQGEQFDRLAEIAPNAGNMPPPLFEALVEASSLRNKEKILASLRGEGKKGPSQQEQKMMQELEALRKQVEENTLKMEQQALAAERKQFALEQENQRLKLQMELQSLQTEQRLLQQQQQQIQNQVRSTATQ